MRKLGSQTKFAKPAVREMACGDLIGSADVWLGFIETRNECSHSYDENYERWQDGRRGRDIKNPRSN